MSHSRLFAYLVAGTTSLLLASLDASNAAEVPEASPTDSEAKGQSEPEAATIESPARLAERRIRQALTKPVSVDLRDTPLDTAIAFLEEDSGIPILLDWRALSEVGIRQEEPVSLEVSEITLRSVLRLMLRPFDLTYLSRHEVLLITTVEEAECQLVAPVYPVGDIITGHTQSGEVIHEFDWLIELITSCAEPSTWECSGPAPVATADFPGVTAIVFLQMQEVHEQVASLLAALRSVGDQTAEGKIPDPMLFDRVWPEPPAYEAVRKALKRKTSVDFQESPLDHVVGHLRDVSGVNVVLDRRALEEVGISPDVPLSFRAADVTLASALRTMLDDLTLTYQVWDEVILITSPEEAEMRLTIGVYPVADLVSGRRDGGGVAGQLNAIEPIVTGIVSPDRWDDVGGPGTMAPAPFERVKALVISQTRDVHQEVVALFEAIREIARREDEDHPGEPVMLDHGTGTRSPADEAVRKALAQEVTIDMHEVPLKDMMSFLHATYGIEVRLEETLLDDVGIPPDRPVTLRVSGVTLGSALHLLLRPLQLTWVVDQGTLVITTPEDAETRTVVGIYPVGDLVVCRDEHGELWDDYDSLIELISCAVVPHAWENVGGPGAVHGATLGSAKVLVVRQTEQIHEQMRELLGQLRHAAAASGGERVPPRGNRPQLFPGLPVQMGGAGRPSP
jgi:hypothetical protein